MVSLQALRNNLTRQRRSLPLLYLTLTLLVVQVMDLHFHVHPSPDRHQSAAVATAQHAATHATHHEDTGAVDLSSFELWKNPDQGWDIIALFAAACILLSINIRGASSSRPARKSPCNQPAFLRPSLRAPPR